MGVPVFWMVQAAVDDGLIGAAVLDREGSVIALAGALAEDEVRPIAAVVTRRLKSEDLARRMFGGEMVELSLEGRDVSVGIAARTVFVVAVLGPAGAHLAVDLRREVEKVIRAMQTEIAGAPAWSSTSGGSSGPGGSPAAELGLPVRRGKN